jgi:hypothetical protein
LFTRLLDVKVNEGKREETKKKKTYPTCKRRKPHNQETHLHGKKEYTSIFYSPENTLS